MSPLDLEDEPLVAEQRAASGRSFLAALGWGFATAVCAAGVWAVALAVGFSRWKDTLALADGSNRLGECALIVGGSVAAAGGIVGAAVGFVRGGKYRGAVAAILGTGGVLFGAAGGSGAVLVAVACRGWVHPLLSSSVVWALAGLLAGLNWYYWSRWLTKGAEAAEEQDAAPVRRIEWLLREARRLLPDSSPVRLLPVLGASAGAFVGAAVAAPADIWLPLFAVGVLGVAVALVLYRQEERLRTLERRSRGTRES
jgi:hypothetical protein